MKYCYTMILGKSAKVCLGSDNVFNYDPNSTFRPGHDEIAQHGKSCVVQRSNGRTVVPGRPHVDKRHFLWAVQIFLVQNTTHIRYYSGFPIRVCQLHAFIAPRRRLIFKEDQGVS